jgi:hypothetical protein
MHKPTNKTVQGERVPTRPLPIAPLKMPRTEDPDNDLSPGR